MGYYLCHTQLIASIVLAREDLEVPPNIVQVFTLRGIENVLLNGTVSDLIENII